jgi:glutamate formiminotransferase/formiminotetrahydrofolate cyclodeaminase
MKSICPQVIEEIAAAIRGSAGCTLLDVDAGASTNRTVYTFVGEPAAVVRGALNAARTASKLINMAVHKGESLEEGVSATRCSSIAIL